MSLLKNQSDRARCTNCGERVTPYAAGCPLCGAELDPRRWQRPPGLAQRALSRLRALTSGSGAD
jgi:predicted amidophosphoribosyltransferase